MGGASALTAIVVYARYFLGPLWAPKSRSNQVLADECRAERSFNAI